MFPRPLKRSLAGFKHIFYGYTCSGRPSYYLWPLVRGFEVIWDLRIVAAGRFRGVDADEG